MADAGQNVSLLEKWTCGTNQCPSEFTGKFCEIKIGLVFRILNCNKFNFIIFKLIINYITYFVL